MLNLLILEHAVATENDHGVMWCLAGPLFVTGLIAVIWPWMVNKRGLPGWMVRLMGLGIMGAVVVWVYGEIRPVVVVWLQ